MSGRENADVNYHAMVDPFTADKRARVIPAFGIRRKVIALDVALVQQEFKLVGDFVYIDFNSTGVALCSLNSPSEDGFPLVPLAGVSDIPFEGLYITSAAQPGLFINLWYGYRSRFISPTSAIATIGSIVNPVSVKGPRAINAGPVLADLPLLTRDVGKFVGSQYISQANLGAGGTGQVFSAASNTNGAIVYDRYSITQSAATNIVALLAKATAPTSDIDGTALYHISEDVAAAYKSGYLNSSPRFIPAGLGLFWFSVLAETAARRYVDYTLL